MTRALEAIRSLRGAKASCKQRSAEFAELTEHLKRLWDHFGIPEFHRQLYLARYCSGKYQSDVLLKEVQALVKGKALVQRVMKAIESREEVLLRLSVLRSAFGDLELREPGTLGRCQLSEQLYCLRVMTAQAVQVLHSWRVSVAPVAGAGCVAGPGSRGACWPFTVSDGGMHWDDYLMHIMRNDSDPKLDDFYEVLRTYWADSEGAGVEAMVDDPYSQDPEAEEGDPGDRPLEAASEVEEPESESSTRAPPIDMYADRVGDDVIDDQESKEEEGDEPAKVEETSEVQRKDEAGNETTEPRKVDAQNVGTTKVEQGQAKEEDTPAPEPSTVLTTPPTKDHGSKSSPVSMPPPPVPKKVSKGEVSAEKIAEVKERIEKLKSQLAMKKALDEKSKITCCNDNVETQPLEDSTYDQIIRAKTLELGECDGDDVEADGAEGEGQACAPLLRGKSSCDVGGSSGKGGGSDDVEIPGDKRDARVEAKDKSLDKTSPDSELPEHPMVSREDQKKLKESNKDNKPGKKKGDAQETKPKPKNLRGRGGLKRPAASQGARSKRTEAIPNDSSDVEPDQTQHYSPESQDENSPLKPAALDQQFSEVDSNPPEPGAKPEPSSKAKTKRAAPAKVEQVKKPKIDKSNQTKGQGKRKERLQAEEPAKKTPKTQAEQSKPASASNPEQDEHLGENDAKNRAVQKKTFAGRACPKKNEQAILRHNVMISTFNAKIGPLCVNTSALELAWWNWAYEYLLQADDQTEKGYRKIASVRASEFMQQPQLRAYKK